MNSSPRPPRHHMLWQSLSGPDSSAARCQEPCAGRELTWQAIILNLQMAREGSLPPEHVTDLVLGCPSVSSKHKRGPQLSCPTQCILPYLSPFYHIPNRWLPSLSLSPSGGQEAHYLRKQLVLFGGSLSYTEPNPFL